MQNLCEVQADGLRYLLGLGVAGLVNLEQRSFGLRANDAPYLILGKPEPWGRFLNPSLEFMVWSRLGLGVCFPDGRPDAGVDSLA